MHRPALIPLFALVSAIAPLIPTPSAIAQSLPACQPPAATEFLLMVITPTAEAQGRLQQSLPPEASTTLCDYLGRSVTRVGGFTTSQNATAWGQYLNDLAGLQSFVARPPATATAGSGELVPVDPLPTAQPAPTQPTPPRPTATAPARPAAPRPTAAAGQPTARTTYNPQPLRAGYAVLVNYANRPEVASAVQRATANRVGLVSYEQRPYLLAGYTPDASAAATLLKTLSDRGFSAMIVDSRRAVLLTPAVAVE
jgi:hypothetical protein